MNTIGGLYVQIMHYLNKCVNLHTFPEQIFSLDKARLTIIVLFC